MNTIRECGFGRTTESTNRSDVWSGTAEACLVIALVQARQAANEDVVAAVDWLKKVQTMLRKFHLIVISPLQVICKIGGGVQRSLVAHEDR